MERIKTRKVERDEILDYVTYSQQRSDIRARIMTEKAIRRIHVGPVLTFLFENHDTIWYQIQEMIRAEQIVKEADIQYEIDTYNELLGDEGEFGCALLIEIDDIEERKRKLTKWLDLPKRVYLLLDSGDKIYATFDLRQVGEERLSSVQYIKFKTRGKTPVAVGADMPEFSELNHEISLTQEQRTVLEKDLSSNHGLTE